MKTQVTQKSVREAYTRVLRVGDGALQNLLRHERPRSYTAGIYGWNADIYVIDGVAIATGYRSFGTKVPYELAKKYDRAAAEIRERRLPYEETKEKLNALAVEFVREAP